MTNNDDKPVTANRQVDSAEEQPGTAEKTTINRKGDTKTRPTEHGGPKGLEPTRYGDWERNGRCTDF